METTEQNPTNIVEETFPEFENLQPVPENKIKKGFKAVGKVLILIVVFIALFALVCASHTYSYHL